VQRLDELECGHRPNPLVLTNRCRPSTFYQRAVQCAAQSEIPKRGLDDP
jgi:hypothetical protein